MPLIDDQGRLFGLVNVVDALVVLLILAVVVAGIAVVDPFATPDRDRDTAPATPPSTSVPYRTTSSNASTPATG